MAMSDLVKTCLGHSHLLLTDGSAATEPHLERWWAEAKLSACAARASAAPRCCASWPSAAPFLVACLPRHFGTLPDSHGSRSDHLCGADVRDAAAGIRHPRLGSPAGDVAAKYASHFDGRPYHRPSYWLCFLTVLTIKRVSTIVLPVCRSS